MSGLIVTIYVLHFTYWQGRVAALTSFFLGLGLYPQPPDYYVGMRDNEVSSHF
jgi:hypothetical protein